MPCLQRPNLHGSQLSSAPQDSLQPLDAPELVAEVGNSSFSDSCTAPHNLAGKEVIHICTAQGMEAST